MHRKSGLAQPWRLPLVVQAGERVGQEMERPLPRILLCVSETMQTSETVESSLKLREQLYTWGQACCQTLLVPLISRARARGEAYLGFHCVHIEAAHDLTMSDRLRAQSRAPMKTRANAAPWQRLVQVYSATSSDACLQKGAHTHMTCWLVAPMGTNSVRARLCSRRMSANMLTFPGPFRSPCARAQVY